MAQKLARKREREAAHLVVSGRRNRRPSAKVTAESHRTVFVNGRAHPLSRGEVLCSSAASALQG